MMKRSSIPTKLTDYNVYNEGECLIGIEAEVTLPELAAELQEQWRTRHLVILLHWN
mgnify:CR=1 FL=1